MKKSDELKQAAAVKAVSLVASGMVVGLGTGSTAAYAVAEIARRLNNGELEKIVCIPTSRATEKQAFELKIPLVTLADHSRLDITIDGADEVDARMNLIKGGGGALLREKVVAQASDKLVIVIDASKQSEVLGTKWHVPVEVVPFAVPAEQNRIERLGAHVQLRLQKEGEPFVTDNGNNILDCNFGRMPEPEKVAMKLSAGAGVVEHGLFIQMATDLLVATDSGVEHRTSSRT